MDIVVFFRKNSSWHSAFASYLAALLNVLAIVAAFYIALHPNDLRSSLFGLSQAASAILITWFPPLVCLGSSSLAILLYLKSQNLKLSSEEFQKRGETIATLTGRETLYIQEQKQFTDKITDLTNAAHRDKKTIQRLEDINGGLEAAYQQERTKFNDVSRLAEELRETLNGEKLAVEQMQTINRKLAEDSRKLEVKHLSALKEIGRWGNLCHTLEADRDRLQNYINTRIGGTLTIGEPAPIERFPFDKSCKQITLSYGNRMFIEIDAHTSNRTRGLISYVLNKNDFWIRKFRVAIIDANS